MTEGTELKRENDELLLHSSRSRSSLVLVLPATLPCPALHYSRRCIIHHFCLPAIDHRSRCLERSVGEAVFPVSFIYILP